MLATSQTVEATASTKPVIAKLELIDAHMDAGRFIYHQVRRTCRRSPRWNWRRICEVPSWRIWTSYVLFCWCCERHEYLQSIGWSPVEALALKGDCR